MKIFTEITVTNFDKVVKLFDREMTRLDMTVSGWKVGVYAILN
jgi:hypothetical protein